MLEQIEEARKIAVKKQNKCYLITALIGIGIFSFIVFITGDFSFDLFTIIHSLMFTIVPTIILGVIIVSIFSSKEVKRFKDLYKKNIVEATFKEVFTDVFFDVDKGIDYSVIYNTGMMDMGDSFSSNDYATGKYKNINFAVSDVNITETYTDSDGDSHTVTLFSGQWYIFDFNKSFKANVQVKDTSFHNARTYRKKGESKYQKVELEDIDFNKKFKCFAQEPIDAFYIMTPRMMERLKIIKEKMKHSLLFCFIDNRLHIGVSTGKDLYEPNLRKPVNLESARAVVLNDLQPIIDFIDGLELDNDLFKR